MNQKLDHDKGGREDLRFEENDSLDMHRGSNPVETGIQNMIERMVNTKKKQEKKFNNNPPKRDLYKTEKPAVEVPDLDHLKHLTDRRKSSPESNYKSQVFSTDKNSILNSEKKQAPT